MYTKKQMPVALGLLFWLRLNAGLLLNLLAKNISLKTPDLQTSG